MLKMNGENTKTIGKWIGRTEKINLAQQLDLYKCKIFLSAKWLCPPFG